MRFRKAALLTVPVAAAAYAVAYTTSKYIGCAMRVNGDSMTPTLNHNTDGRSDIVLLGRFKADWKRGEVVTLWAPDNPSKSLIKRLIAVEGDTVITRESRHGGDAGVHVTIPKGHVWVEGDNASVSLDSNIYGPIKASLLDGHVSCVVWPHPRRIHAQSVKHRLATAPAEASPATSANVAE